jgi:toxin ParE1/3/4
MAELCYRPQARLDLKQVYRHMAEANPTAAAVLVRLIDTKARLIVQSPHIGQGIPELGASLRRFPVGDYLIFYEVTTSGIEVVRILHGARDLETIFRDS